jgi:hypothetical protein
MRRLCLCLALLGPFFAPGVVQAKTWVYCANGKIEVDSRDPQQMRSARGSGVCSFGEHSFLSDAQNHARRFGGPGAACSCGSSSGHPASYWVYCASGKIEVDSRNPEQMKSARGSDVCQFGAHSSSSGARDHARSFGGIGARCGCR